MDNFLEKQKLYSKTYITISKQFGSNLSIMDFICLGHWQKLLYCFVFALRK